MSPGRVLLDGGVLLRLAVPSHGEHAPVVRAVESLGNGEAAELCLSSQVIREAWSVGTRPASARGGLGLEPARIAALILPFTRALTFLPESEATYAEWVRIVTGLGVSGVEVHDANHVATMRVHGVGRLLTLDRKDFGRYGGIEVLHPEAIG